MAINASNGSCASSKKATEMPLSRRRRGDAVLCQHSSSRGPNHSAAIRNITKSEQAASRSRYRDRIRACEDTVQKMLDSWLRKQ